MGFHAWNSVLHASAGGGWGVGGTVSDICAVVSEALPTCT